MGWHRWLKIRLDGSMQKRFTVGGEGKGRPAASSYAGEGEPGFAGDDSWEKYMQVGADAGLEVRAPIAAGSHVVGVSFVRQLWEPEGLPQPLQRGRVITDDQVYMDYASVGSVQIGGPYEIAGPAKRSESACGQPCAVASASASVPRGGGAPRAVKSACGQPCAV